ncbi:MAG TPA: uroporphyrinogen-III synthase [Gemmatimonadales bacterium]|nr:uroporphyrinogen-III synthase [Gemmatimonadales bacterium]
MSAGAVVVTSAAGSFPGLPDALRGISVEVLELPLLTFAPPTDWTEVDRAIRELPRYAAVAFTSPRAALAFRGRWERLGRRALPPVWAAGRHTASALEPLTSDVRTAPNVEIGRIGAAAAVAADMLGQGLRGPVLFPCGEIRRDELPTRLRQEGIEVDEVVCYRSIVADDAVAREALRRAGILIVASPSVAELLARASTSSARPPLLAVGPTTAAAARAAGWAPAAVAAHPDVDALVAEVRSLLAGLSIR